MEKNFSFVSKLVENYHALFRNDPSDLEETQLPLSPVSPYDYDSKEENYGQGNLDIINPFLPPQVNYDKVNKFANYTSDFYKTFYFDPSWSNILLLLGLLAFTLWVIVMNSLTVIGLWRSHRTGHMADLYLANMAIGDALLGILILPLMSVVILLGYFPFSRVVCDLWVFLDYYLIVAASYGSCALVCNYLWMLKWPDTFPIEAKHHIIAISICWIAVNFSWTPAFFIDRMTSVYSVGQCGWGVWRNKYFSFYIGITGFYIPLLISFICGIWSLVELKKASGIPLLSWKQSLFIGRRRRSSRLVHEVIWTFLKILPQAIIQDSLDVEANKEKPKFPKYFGPGAPPKEEDKSIPKKKPPPLKHIKQQSITRKSDPNIISQNAKDHYTLVVTSLILFVICRSLFYIYFGVGAFIRNFFPLDLSNGVYWLMHSNAAISPLIHFAFDPELREEVGRMLCLRNPQNSPVVEPEVVVVHKQAKQEFANSKNSMNNMSRESAASVLSHFSIVAKDETLPSAIKKSVKIDPKFYSDEDNKDQEKMSEVNASIKINTEILDANKLSLSSLNGVTHPGKK